MWHDAELDAEEEEHVEEMTYYFETEELKDLLLDHPHDLDAPLDAPAHAHTQQRGASPVGVTGDDGVFRPSVSRRRLRHVQHAHTVVDGDPHLCGTRSESFRRYRAVRHAGSGRSCAALAD